MTENNVRPLPPQATNREGFDFHVTRFLKNVVEKRSKFFKRLRILQNSSGNFFGGVQKMTEIFTFSTVSGGGTARAPRPRKSENSRAHKIFREKNDQKIMKKYDQKSP